MAAFPNICKIEDFLLGRYVHAGGYGTVYSGTRKKDNKEVALKFFGYTKKKPDIGEIQKEIKLMIDLEGVEGACQYLGVLMDSPEGYAPNKNPDFMHTYPVIVMELLGCDLFIYLEKRETISPTFLAKAFRSTMLALRGIHSRGFLHRDLKIDNIVMSSNESLEAVKIIDFGLMISVEDVNVGVYDIIVGTDGCFAPETLLSKHYSAKSDIWQAGCILYTLLAGFPPFFASKEGNHCITKGEYYPMDIPEWDVPPPAAKDLVQKMLCFDPVKRIDTESILSHPWLANVDSNSLHPGVTMGPNYKLRIKNLVLRNRLKRYFYSNMADSSATPESEDAAKFFFCEFDLDGDGLVGFEEMCRGFRNMIEIDGDVPGINEIEFEQTFDEIDTDQNGKIDFDEFHTFYEAVLAATTISASRRSSVRFSSSGLDNELILKEGTALSESIPGKEYCSIS